MEENRHHQRFVTSSLPLAPTRAQAPSRRGTNSLSCDLDTLVYSYIFPILRTTTNGRRAAHDGFRWPMGEKVVCWRRCLEELLSMRRPPLPWRKDRHRTPSKGGARAAGPSPCSRDPPRPRSPCGGRGAEQRVTVASSGTLGVRP